jgi:cytochrome d ubiquinol oxidase subunit I
VDTVVADRLQFAFTVMFHYLFPIGTMGLAPFVAWYTVKAARTGDADAAKSARFWTKIFAVNFAAGVVTGIPMEFQFGTNWAAFSARTGEVIGQPLAMEGLFAFFLESIFLGVLLYGHERAFRGDGLSGLLALRLFHRRYRRLDAASRRLRRRA